MRITVIGCLHGYHPKLDGGDILIVTGDITARGKSYEYIEFKQWLLKQDYKKIIFIAGNHDQLIEMGRFKFTDWGNIEYLCNSGTEYENLKIWGSPNSLWFPEINPHCAAFTGNEDDLKKEYDKIPDDIDILITHTPPHGILDANKAGIHCGSIALREAVERVKPTYHFFSHIHEANGYCMLKSEGYGEENNTHCYNVSIMDEYYRPINKPFNIEIK